MRAAERIVEGINRVAEVLAVAVFASLILSVATAVFFRYVLNDSLVWSEELARYLFIWVTFLGGGLGVGRNIHVGVDSIVMRFSTGTQLIIQVIVEVAITIFVVALIVVGIQLVDFAMATTALLLPVRMGYVYLAVPVGGAVMLANILLQTVQHTRDLLRA